MKTIVCPTDFSTCAQNAIEYAYEVAIRMQANLLLLHTVFSPDAMPYAGLAIHPELSAVEETHDQERLHQICRQLQARNPQAGVRYRTMVGTRPAADEISHVAHTEQADLVVMGTSGAYGLKELLIGSTAASVIELTKKPVLVIPEEVTFTPVERIVFAADLTEKHPCDLTELVAIARLFKAQILFLHVLKERSQLKSNLAQIHYSDLYSMLGYDRISFHIREESDIEKGILQFSQEKKAGLIVMVNHKKNLLQSLLKGSQTKKMAYHSPVPLLAIHS